MKSTREHRHEPDLFEAASTGDADRVMQLVDRDPGMVNHYSPDGFTPLGLATFFGHYDTVLSLLDLEADPDIPSNNEMKVTPLHSACASGRYEIAELLLLRGSNVNARQSFGITPLHSAAHNGHTGLAELLFKNGADAKAKTDDSKTPLDMAGEAGHNQTSELIKKHL